MIPHDVEVMINRHPPAPGVFARAWIPACAGMTERGWLPFAIVNIRQSRLK